MKNTKAAEKIFPPLNILAGKVHESIGVDNIPLETYAIYLPKDYDTKTSYPLYLFCDPQGSGAYPLSKYQSLAEAYHVILVGSNNCKNGVDLNDCISYIDHILDDVEAKYAIDDSMINIYGFSGGAKVATLYASQANGAKHNIHSLICSGATAPIDQAPQHCPILVFAGNRDMNYSDLLNFQSQAMLQKDIYNVTLLEFNGKHEWPDTFTSEYAFAMNATPGGADQRIEKFIHQIEINNYITVLDKLNAFDVAVHLFGTKSNLKNMQQFITTTMEKAETKLLIQEKESQLKSEQSTKDYYNSLIGVKDLSWWETEVNKLNHPDKTSDKAISARVLGFLSLAGYSYSNRYINQGDFINAKKMLDFYAVVDPTNSDQPYLLAVLYAKKGEKENAINSLKKAVDMGYSNKGKILSEPAFNLIINEEAYKKLMMSLH